MESSVYEKRQRSRMRWAMERLSSQCTRQIAAHFGDNIPCYCVSEYPRSGGSWLSNMMADYLRCARPGISVLPLAVRAVLHNHWKYHPRLKRVVYLYRDGRDVMTSFYFYRMRAVEKGDQAIRRRIESVLGKGFDPQDTPRNFPKVMELEFSSPRASFGLHWGRHVLNWYAPDARPQILYLSYESLLEDPFAVLRRAIEHVSPIETDDRLIHRSVDHYAMESLTGREQGTESRGDFIRKGIAGDWVNHFTRETAEVFDHYAGKALIRLGYEQDCSWVQRVSEKPPSAPQ